ncbi:glycosyltransferase family 92 protein RCOM_0530710-like [Lycium ferocissimum]|uniref:glycosyltransferase family 92 protein RCOM_0530710-like n=1 Tax=Lycium ferocissimum TaxID=112874 RepID=UPI0028164636|nr:glycosyltransferase family 92 protein RCOM_0530710-like [Lycium ferocissimum]
MQHHRKKRAVLPVIQIPRKSLFLCTLLLVCFVGGFTFSSIRLLFRGFHPWRPEATTTITRVKPNIPVTETVEFPDEIIVFLKYPSSTPLFTKHDIYCIYLTPNSSQQLKQSPELVENDELLGQQLVRCPLIKPRGVLTSLSVEPSGYTLSVGPIRRWYSLAYEAMIDRDNTTIVFVKGFKLRGGKQSDPSKFKCVYGWDVKKHPKFMLQSDVVSVAQEVVRCNTPTSILNSPERYQSIKVSVRMVGKEPVESIASPKRRLRLNLPGQKQHQMCVCTMLRNQASFLKEWIMYHTKIGVQRWFIYDNNSLDDIEDVVKVLSMDGNINLTRHVWPWIKTQEAGFAHCALRARDVCEWVGFMDVDEFFHLPTGLSLLDILRNQSKSPNNNVAELRVSCHTFGPSGLIHVPTQGVTMGYNCRMIAPERHKSIVKPEALNSTLINVVHHFHLKSEFRHANMDRNVMVINHYKYQVWDVFKEKFYRRVATYVSDWQQDRNVGSKDRAPGLGTRAVEPPDWSSRFCEVIDTGLKDRVAEMFTNPSTGKLPWQKSLT